MPDDAGMSPQMTLKSVVFPAPFGPRIARALAVDDVEVDLVDGEKPAEPPADPRKRRVGSACSTAGAASVTDLLDDLVGDDAVLDDLDLAPATAASRFTQGG